MTVAYGAIRCLAFSAFFLLAPSFFRFNKIKTISYAYSGVQVVAYGLERLRPCTDGVGEPVK